MERPETGAPKSPKRVLVAVVPKRLGVPARPEGLPDSVMDKGHERVAEQARHWQQMAGNASFWEMGATQNGAELDRAYELAGQMASTGEQLALALAAAGEVALWREVRDAAEPADEMCMRAMAESQCLFVIGAGHGLANVAARALCLNPALRCKLAGALKRKGPQPYIPFSDDTADWVSMNAKICGALQATAASASAHEVAALIEPVVALGTGSSWKALIQRRGEDFHRWRPQTHGIEGVPRSTPWKHEGNVRRLGLGPLTYEDAVGRADETASIATTATLDLARAMECFLKRWPQASGRLGGPEFQRADRG